MALRVSRRTFLGGSIAVVVVGACTSDDSGSSESDDGSGPDPGSSSRVEPVAAPESPFDVDPFALGVASGDPDQESVVLWTRLAPDPLAADGGAGAEDHLVAFDVATDAAFDDLVASDTVSVNAEDGHSLHLEVGGLAAGTVHHYRFRIGEHTSAVGRTKTMPAEGSDEPFRFVFASCQDHEDGFYGAHRHLAADEPDLVVWLGDYIYEGEGRGLREGQVRAHEGPEPRTVEQYRTRYAQYRLDADLRAAHQAAPWAVTWDDHEVANNHAGDISDGDEAPEAFRARRAAAYQAWYEHQPVRLPAPTGPDYPIHRTISAGDLVAFHLLDTRQFRSDQACDADGDLGEPCAAVDDEDRTMLGADQEAWLDGAVEESDAVWDVVGNQMILSPARFELGPVTVANLDQWDGYAAARRRLYATLAKADNPVVVTGDIHASVAAQLTVDPDDPASAPLGAEFVGTSISSSFPAEFVSVFESAVEASPLALFADAARRGYVRCDVDRSTFRATYRLVADATVPDTDITDAAVLELTAGDRRVELI